MQANANAKQAAEWISNWREGKTANVAQPEKIQPEQGFTNPLAGFRWPWQGQQVFFRSLNCLGRGS